MYRTATEKGHRLETGDGSAQDSKTFDLWSKRNMHCLSSYSTRQKGANLPRNLKTVSFFLSFLFARRSNKAQGS